MALELKNQGYSVVKLDEVLDKFRLISNEIQKQSAKYFDTASGRYYPDAKDGIGARSYRIIQLLEKGFKLTDIKAHTK